MADAGGVTLPAAAAILEFARPRLVAGPAWTLLIDGRSGSGKSTLAAWLAPRLRAPVLSMECLYAGWGGLAASAELLAGRVLPARAAGRAVRWREWDWHRDAPGDWVVVRPGAPLIVEGCGSLTPASRRFATLAITLAATDTVREQRAAARDPESTAPLLRAWRVDERRFIARSHPAAVSDRLLQGGVGPGIEHVGRLRGQVP